MGRRRRLDHPRLPQLRHRARRHLQRLSGARREDRAGRHGQGPFCRRTAAERGLAGRSGAASTISSATTPSWTIRAPCRKCCGACRKPRCCATRNVPPRWPTTSTRPAWKIRIVANGETVSLGRRTLQFIETPMVHWPESMFTYVPEERLLFSMDAFGQHYATSERFDDEADLPARDAGSQDLLRQYRHALRQGGARLPGAGCRPGDRHDRAQPRADLAPPRARRSSPRIAIGPTIGRSPRCW